MARAGTLRELPKSIGRYVVEKQIGAGAMGRVLLSHDPVLERHVAIKLLRDDLAIGSDVRDGLVVRMRHEARAAARVTHPNLVVIHDMGEDEDLGLYLVFEYLEGPTLKQQVSERRLSPRRAAKLAKELGSALSFAHEKGVLHRDVKPENIILTPNGSKLADFGIARVPDSTLTHAGGLLGTPAYSAPETFRDSKFSAASDQFSLAATLYEALSGERAFPGDDAVSVASKITHDPPAPFAAARGYGESLDGVFGRALAKAPEDRFETCAAFGEALVRALAEVPAPAGQRVSDTSANPMNATATRISQAPFEERKPWRVVLGGIVVVTVLALLARAYLRNQDAALDAQQPAASSEASAEPIESATEPVVPKKPITPVVRTHDHEPTAVGSEPTVSSSHPDTSGSASPSAPETSASAAVPAPPQASAQGTAAPGHSPSPAASSAPR